MRVLTDQSRELSRLTFHYHEAMLAERYHVFALDQRGHGESARPGISAFELMRDDLKAFADELALSRFTLIGHAMGGTVASLFSEQWPERIERLVLADTVPPYPGSMGPF